MNTTATKSLNSLKSLTRLRTLQDVRTLRSLIDFESLVRTRWCLFLLLCLVLRATAISQEQGISTPPRNIVVIAPGETLEEIVQKAAHVAPSPRQGKNRDTFRGREGGNNVRNSRLHG